MHNKPIDSAEVIRNYAKPLFGFALNRLGTGMKQRISHRRLPFS